MGPAAGSIEDMESSITEEDGGGGGKGKEVEYVDLAEDDDDIGFWSHVQSAISSAVHSNECQQVISGDADNNKDGDVSNVSNENPNSDKEEDQEGSEPDRQSQEDAHEAEAEKSDENRNLLTPSTTATTATASKSESSVAPVASEDSLDDKDSGTANPFPSHAEEYRMLDTYPYINLPFGEPPETSDFKGFKEESSFMVALWTVTEKKSEALYNKVMAMREAQAKAIDQALEERNGILEIPNKSLKAYMVAVRLHKAPEKKEEEEPVKKKAKVIHTPVKANKQRSPSPKKTSPEMKPRKAEDEMETSPSSAMDNSSRRMKSSSTRKSIQPPKRYSEDEVILLENEVSPKQRQRKPKLKSNSFEMGLLPPKYPKKAEHSPSSSTSTAKPRRKRTLSQSNIVEEEVVEVEPFVEVEMEQQEEIPTDTLKELEGDSLFQISGFIQSRDYQMIMMGGQQEQQGLMMNRGMEVQLQEDDGEFVVEDTGYDSAPEPEVNDNDTISIQCNKCMCVFQIVGMNMVKPEDWFDYQCNECLEATAAERRVPQLMPISRGPSQGKNKTFGLHNLMMQSNFQSRAKPNDLNEEQLVMPPPPPPSPWGTPKSSLRSHLTHRRLMRLQNEGSNSAMEHNLGIRLPPNTTLTKVKNRSPKHNKSDVNFLRGQLDKHGCSFLSGFLAPNPNLEKKSGSSSVNGKSFEVPKGKYPMEFPTLPMLNGFGSSSVTFPAQVNGVTKLPKLKKTAAKTTTILDTPKITLVPKSRCSKRKHALPETSPNAGNTINPNMGLNPSLQRAGIEIPSLSRETFLNPSAVPRPQAQVPPPPPLARPPTPQIQRRPTLKFPNFTEAQKQFTAQIPINRKLMPIRTQPQSPQPQRQMHKPKPIRPISAPFPNMSTARLRQQLQNPPLNMLPRGRRALSGDHKIPKLVNLPTRTEGWFMGMSSMETASGQLRAMAQTYQETNPPQIGISGNSVVFGCESNGNLPPVKGGHGQNVLPGTIQSILEGLIQTSRGGRIEVHLNQ